MTVVLVTHFMEEAERLGDRIALIDAGRVVALDTPAGIVPVDAEQRLRFRPSAPLDDPLLTGLPEVRSVDPRAARRSSSPAPATSPTPSRRVLARHEIVANDLRIEQADLDDAFIALTGRRLASDR